MPPSQQLEAMSGLGCALLAARDPHEVGRPLMEQLPRIVRHDKSIFSWRSAGGTSHSDSLTIAPEVVAQYDDVFAPLDYTAWYLSQSDVEVYRDSDVIDAKVMAKSRIFNEWVAPMGMRHLCGGVVRVDGIQVADILLFRSCEKGDFTEDELDDLQLVVRLLKAWFATHRELTVAAEIAADGSGSTTGESTGASHDRSGGPGARPKVTKARDPLSGLTKREREIAHLIAEGFSTEAVSSRLVISPATTRKHLANIFAKLGVSSRLELHRLVEGDNRGNR